MAERVETVVVGAGVVGLAVARALALQGREVLLLEQHDAFGTETSSRNSEVIHAGIYYRPGGLRAAFCHPGKQMLYAYARERSIGHLNCGKLIVAESADDIARFPALIATAQKNGVDDLVILSARGAQELEPELSCAGAILSPSSGIIDSHNLMLSFLGDFEEAGGMFALKAPVVAGAVGADGIRLDIGGDEPMSLEASHVINCAGLHAASLAGRIDGLDAEQIPVIRPATGRYFTYSGKAPFSRLIYPMHTPDSQGIHYTRDLGGQARLGPDITWDKALGDYHVDADLRSKFAEAGRKFWPGIDEDKLHAGYAGQRPKATGPGEEGDFRILGPSVHGTPGYIGLYAIESPGLTSCLAIGEHVANIAKTQFA